MFSFRLSFASASRRAALRLRLTTTILLMAAGLAAGAQTNFGTVNVGASAMVTVTVSIPNGGTLGVIAVLTQGAPNQDYTNAGGGTCATGAAYAANATCTVNIAFAPLFPGARYGAVVLSDSGNDVIGTRYLQGTGKGPMAAFLQGYSADLGGAGLTIPGGIAIDGNGNIFVSDYEYNVVDVYTSQSGVTMRFGPGLQLPLDFPTGVAVDGSGSVYIVDSGNHRIVKETFSGTEYIPIGIALGLSSPLGIAVDGSGNVYVADFGSGQVVMETPSGSSYTQSYLPLELTGPPSGVAVDGNGNLFVAVPAEGGKATAVYMETPSGNGYIQSSIGSGLKNAVSVAVDACGNVYIGDLESGSVYKETLSNGSYTQSTLIANAGAPGALAVDGSGNVYVGSEVGMAIWLSYPVSTAALNFNSSVFGQTSSDSPMTVTVANLGNSALKISAVNFPPDFPEGSSGPGECEPGTALAPALGTCTLTFDFKPASALNGSTVLSQAESLTLTTNIVNGAGSSPTVALTGTEILAADTVALSVPDSPTNAGNPVTFTATVAGNSRIPTGTVTFNSVSGPINFPANTTLGAGTLNASGIATFTTSSLPVGTYSIDAIYSGDSLYPGETSAAIVESIVSAPAVSSFGNSNMGTLAVGGPGVATPLSITFDTAETLGSIAVLTDGAPNLDFTNSGGGSCTIGAAYAANATCTVNVSFKPLHAGQRNGAVVLTGNNGNRIGTGYLQGIGQGPQTSFLPWTQTTVASGFGWPYGVAVDGSGNVYVADAMNSSSVYMETLANGKYSQSTIGSGCVTPNGVAVDGSGTVYIACGGYGESPGFLLRETPFNGSYLQTQIGSGYQQPNAIAVDGSGNLYVTDAGSAFTSAAAVIGLYKETLTNGQYVHSMIASGFLEPHGVAVDGAGNVFVADYNAAENGGAIYKETPQTNGRYAQSTIVSGLDACPSLAVDGGGNVYFELFNDLGAPSGIYKAVLSNGSYITSEIAGADGSYGMVVDGSGNLYVAEVNPENIWDVSVVKLDFADPPALSFASTPPGVKSSDSPQSITLWNSGNEPLTFSVPPAGTNPAITANYSLDNSTTCPQLNGNSQAGTLAAGASCVYAVNFTPATAGAVNGSIVLTDNNLNAVNAPQTFSLSGAGAAGANGTRTTLTSSHNPSTYGQDLTITATVAQQSGSAAPAGTVQLLIDGIQRGSATLNAGTATWDWLSAAYGVPDVGNHILTAVYTPQQGSAESASTSNALTEVVNADTPTLSETTYPNTITAAMDLFVDVTIAGTNPSLTPHGTATLTSGSYTSAPTLVETGFAAFVIPAGSLPLGTDKYTVVFTPTGLSNYTGASGSNTITVIEPGHTTPTVTIALASPTITTAQPLGVTVTVSTGVGTSSPSGSVTLTSGGYVSPATTLVGGIATITLSAGTLAIGTDTLTADYTPDASTSWTTASNTASVIVTAPVPGFSINGTAATVAPGGTTGNTSTITVTPSAGFTGSVALTAAITSSPAGAQDLPTLSFGSTSPVSITGVSAATATLTIGTTAPTSAALVHPQRPGAPWYATGGATLACILLFGIPARRRRWRIMLMMLLLVTAFAGGVLSCGGGGGVGGGGGGGGGGTSNPGTTAGSYTITVTGISGTTTETGTFNLVVQ
jgi:sugar lactone lactonase YvrE